MSNPSTSRFRTFGLLAFGVGLGSAVALVSLIWVMPLKIFQGDPRIEWDATSLSKSSNLERDVFSQSNIFYELLLNSDQEVTLELLEQSKSIASEELRNVAQTSIVQRLTAIDPIAALAAIAELPGNRHDALAATIFGEWSLIDIDGAVAHAATLDGEQKLASLSGIFASREDLSKDERDEISGRIGLPTVPEVESDSLVSGFQSMQPELRWETLVGDDLPNASQTAVLIRIAHQWVDESGFDVVNRIGDTLTNPIVREAVVASVLHQATIDDPSLALQQSEKITGEIRQLALKTIAEAMVSIDPFKAIESLAIVESGSTRRHLLRHVVLTWARSDPDEFLNNLELIPSNMQSLGKQQATMVLARVDPQRIAPMLAEVSDEDFKLDLALEVATSWSEIDLELALEWANSDQIEDEGLRWWVLNTLLSKLALDDPNRALQIALNQPVGENSMGLEATVIAQVSTFNPDLAHEMLAQARDGWAKAAAYTSVGQALVRNNETDRMLELATHLPDEQLASYYFSVFNLWASTQPEGLFAKMENLPTTEAKYHAAMELVRYNVGKNVLSKDQMQIVKTFLPDDYNPETGRRGSERSGRVFRVLTGEEAEQARIEYRRVRSQTTWE
ncbi:MAG: hypothetical protein OXG08_03830 [Gammaproteobacteria bacterium]|nr:hypothetical protein [Gammaproteobacteria bacterium]